MFHEGDYVVYKKDVVKIVGLRTNPLNNIDYYILIPVNDESLKIDVPVSNPLNNIRSLISKEEINDLIKKIPSIEVLLTNNKLIENNYRGLLNEGSHESLIKIIKTTYLRNKERLDNNKKLGDKDSYYFKLAEKYLYTELSLVLHISYDEAREYVIKEVKKLAND